MIETLVQMGPSQSKVGYHQGREHLAYAGLAKSGLDVVFDNLMDGACTITSKHG